jgi:hypothetical protein
MGAGGSVEAREGAVLKACEWLGKDDVLACKNRFASISSGRHSVHVCALVKRIGALKGVPAPQLGWLAAEVAELVGPEVVGASERVTEAG